MAYNASTNETELLKIKKGNIGNYQVVTKVENTKTKDVSVDLRNMFTSDEGEILPTKKGIRISGEDLLDVMKALILCLDVTELDDLKEDIDNLLDENEVEDCDTPEDSEE